MALGVTFTERHGILHMSGWLDEHADLMPLLSSPAKVLKVNVKNVRAVNSLGLRRFIDAMRTLGGREMEFHECSPVFVEAINTVPLSIGGQKRVARVKSVLAPMSCNDGHKATVLVHMHDLKVANGTISMTKPSCSACGGALSLENGMDPDDYFFFLIAGG